jgi:hypothetical protein
MVNKPGPSFLTCQTWANEKKKKKKKIKNFRPRREKGETALHRHSRNKIKKYSAGNKREKTGEFKYVASYQKHSVAII